MLYLACEAHYLLFLLCSYFITLIGNKVSHPGTQIIFPLSHLPKLIFELNLQIAFPLQMVWRKILCTLLFEQLVEFLVCSICFWADCFFTNCFLCKLPLSILYFCADIAEKEIHFCTKGFKENCFLYNFNLPFVNPNTI